MSKDETDELAKAIPSATGQNDAKKTKAKTLDDQIVELKDKLRRLEEEKKERDRREKERNVRQIQDLIKAHRLDAVPASAWESAMPELLKILKVPGQSR